VRIVSEEAAKERYYLRSIHIPKTIDNDLMGSDHAPGFPSAARFVAQAFMGADLDNRSLPGVYVAVVMGRNAGFLTAASSAARSVEGDGPHLIYLPERTFDQGKFLPEVKSVHDRLGRCVIAVSEGIHDADGTPLAIKLTQTAEKDAYGNVQLSGTGALAERLCEEIKSKLGIKRVRGDTFGYLQRSFAGCTSDVDRREARSRRIRRQPGNLGAARRLGGDPADRGLRRRLRPGEAGKGCRRDQGDAGCVYRRLGQRRYACLHGLSAATARQRHATASTPTRRFHCPGTEAIEFTAVSGSPVHRRHSPASEVPPWSTQKST
jgi:hypothetical protein